MVLDLLMTVIIATFLLVQFGRSRDLQLPEGSNLKNPAIDPMSQTSFDDDDDELMSPSSWPNR